MKFVVFLGALLALAGVTTVFLLSQNYNLDKGTGMVAGSIITNSDQANPDFVEIRKDELKHCCTKTEGVGAGKSCYVLQGKDCSHCDQFCS